MHDVVKNKGNVSKRKKIKQAKKNIGQCSAIVRSNLPGYPGRMNIVVNTPSKHGSICKSLISHTVDCFISRWGSYLIRLACHLRSFFENPDAAIIC